MKPSELLEQIDPAIEALDGLYTVSTTFGREDLPCLEVGGARIVKEPSDDPRIALRSVYDSTIRVVANDKGNFLRISFKDGSEWIVRKVLDLLADVGEARGIGVRVYNGRKRDEAFERKFKERIATRSGADGTKAGSSRPDSDFSCRLADGSARRFDLGDGVTLDLVRVGEGDDAYYMGRFPVTQGQYEAVTGENPSAYDGEDHASHPVEMVSWDDATVFCEKLNEHLSDQLGGLVFSLPAEEQWEESAKAGAETAYAGGDDLDAVGWYDERSGCHTCAVGEKNPNGWGLYDMSGNVWEWCLDADGGTRANRGGSWHSGADCCRIDSRIDCHHDARYDFGGFRVVLEPRGLIPDDDDDGEDDDDDEDEDIWSDSDEDGDEDGDEDEFLLAPLRYPNSSDMPVVELSAHYGRLDKSFLEQVASGEALRFNLDDGVTLDLVKVGDGDDAYYMGRFPVTGGQYFAMTYENPSDYDGHDYDCHPVENVSWHDAMAFCEQLNEKLADRLGGLVFSLPTGGQWEESALAGEETDHAGGDDLEEVGWYKDNSDGHTHAVGLKRPNALGLYDMSGNVDEWCLDKNGDGDPRFHGGGFDDDESCCRARRVSWNHADCTYRNTGFRVVLESRELLGRLRKAAEAKAEAAGRDRLATLDRIFLRQVASGAAKRLDLGDGVHLDLIKVGEGDGAYYMGRFPVTQGQYRAVTGDNPSGYDGEDRVFHPVENVSWEAARDFCTRLTEKLADRLDGSVFSLPAEKQWAESARAMEMTSFAGGDNLDEVGWYDENSGSCTRAIGLKAPNAWGFYDMSGNVWEWCLEEGGACGHHVRGGGFENDETACLVAFLLGNPFCDKPLETIGLRVVLESRDLAERCARAAEPPHRIREREMRDMTPVELAAHYAHLDKAFLPMVESGDGIRVNLGQGVSLDLVRIPGSARKPVFMGRFPVTQRQYQVVMGKNPSCYEGADAEWCPVENVSREDALGFCARIGKRLNASGALPDEVGLAIASCSSGFNNDREADWFAENSDGRPHPVGLRKPNALGLYDILGNVCEWTDCEDDEDDPYNPYYDDGVHWTKYRVYGESFDSDYEDVREGEDGRCYFDVGFRVAISNGSLEREPSGGRGDDVSGALTRETAGLADLYAGLSPDPAGKGRPHELRSFDLGNGVSLDLVRVCDGPGGYYMGRFPVTQGQYEAVMGGNPSCYVGPGREWHPVEEVSWGDASEFCARLNERFGDQLGGLLFCLPSEKLRRDAYRAGPYAEGVPEDEIAWNGLNSGGSSHAVGLKRPAANGLYDLFGNVAEWLSDEWEFLGGTGHLYFAGGWGDWNVSGYHVASRLSRSKCLGFRVTLQPADWLARHDSIRREDLEGAFQARVSEGKALRLDLDGGVTLDLVKVGDGADAYYMGRFPVTQGQYEAVTGENPSAYDGEDRALHPVEMVSWHDATAFCAKLNDLPAERRDGLVFDLPTEAQWEKAAYAGEETAYAGGDDLDEVGWYVGNYPGDHTHAVGEKKPNAWGLYDMSGNVWEWCLDKDGSGRAIRGGSWDDGHGGCRVDFRFSYGPDFRRDYGGFRVAASRSSK